jgi:hypothetical protein
MKNLTEHEFCIESQPALRKVFLNDDPRRIKFGSSVESKIFVYEYWPPSISLTNAIIDTVLQFEEEGFYFSNLIRNEEGIGCDTHHWWIPFSDKSIYFSENTDIFHHVYQMENVLYSPNGSWGLMSSFERFGILAGSKNIVEGVYRKFPSMTNQIFDFLNYVKDTKAVYGNQNVDISWLFPLLVEIYDVDTASQMFKDLEI